MKLKVLLFVFGSIALNTSVKGQVQHIDTNFCKFFSEFTKFNATQNNAKELDRIEMGFDTIPKMGESSLDSSLRIRNNSIKQLKYRNCDVYSVLNQIDNNKKANIVYDKLKKVVYYKEEIRFDKNNFKTTKNGFIELFRVCKDSQEYGFVEEKFDVASHVDKGWLDVLGDLEIHVFKLKNYESDLRIVINSCSWSSNAHLDFYLIHKDQIKEILTK